MLALDHIVVAGSNVEIASRNYGNQFSIKAVKGGEHSNWGTYNYLAYFANDAYVEWLGVYDESIAERTENPLIQHLVHILEIGEKGPFQFALRTNQLDQYITHFENENIPFKGPFPGQRVRPDGTMIKWRMLFPDYDFRKNMLPFLIEWDEPNNERKAATLFNPQAIMNIDYNGVSKEVFTHIYQLRPKRLLKNQYPLQNAKITFTNKQKLGFKLA